jgi:protein-disulfide isomerase
VALVIVMGFGARLLLSGPSSTIPPPDPEPPKQAQPFGPDAMKGNPAAPVGIIAYSEFQCPFCARFALTTFPRLETAYIKTNRVAFAFRHFPLEAIHPAAVGAARAATCADEQGRFWSMHDRLFAQQAGLSDDLPATIASELGLDIPRWRTCVDRHDTGETVKRETAHAVSLGLAKTPSFLIGTLGNGTLDVRQVIVGARPFEEFAAIIDQLLRESGDSDRTRSSFTK